MFYNTTFAPANKETFASFPSVKGELEFFERFTYQQVVQETFF